MHIWHEPNVHFLNVPLRYISKVPQMYISDVPLGYLFRRIFFMSQMYIFLDVPLGGAAVSLLWGFSVFLWGFSAVSLGFLCGFYRNS